jgi:hypothetical protein
LASSARIVGPLFHLSYIAAQLAENADFLHCLVNGCARFLVRALLRPIPRFLCTRKAFFANVGNLVFSEMFNAN